MKKKINMTSVLFGVYCLLLIWVIIFKTATDFADIKFLFVGRSINIIPFYYQDSVSTHAREVVLNLIIFIPFGLYLKMLDVTDKISVLCGFAVSLIFEACQFIFGVGASDITDIITNTLGTVIGVYSYVLAIKLFVNRAKINKIINISALTVTIMFLLLTVLLFVANQ